MSEKIFHMSYLMPPLSDSKPYENLFFDNDFRITYHQLFDKVIDMSYHTHNYYEFELVIDGHGTNNIMSNETEIAKGHFFFVSPSAFHCINAAKGSSLTIINFKLKDSFSDQLLNLFGTEYYATVSLSEEETDDLHTMLIHALEQSKDMSDSLQKMYIKNVVENIILIFANHYYHSQKRDAALNENENLINKVILYIRQNYSQSLSLNQLSQKYGYSPNYISQMIRRATGMTFKNYVNHLKMETAYNLILYQDIPFKQIAFDVGYENYTSFLDMFTKKYGMSPSQLRSQTKESK